MRKVKLSKSHVYRGTVTIIASMAVILSAMLASSSTVAGQSGVHTTATNNAGITQAHVRKHFPACPITGCTTSDVTTSVTQAVNWLVTQQTAPDNAANPNRCWATFPLYSVGESALAELQIIHSGLVAGSPADQAAVGKGALCLMSFVQGPGDIDNTNLTTYTTSLATWALQDYIPMAPIGGGPSAASVSTAVANARAWLIANQTNDTTGRADVPIRTTVPTFATTHYSNGGWYYYAAPNSGYAEFSNSSFAVQALAATGGVPGAAPVPPSGSTADLAQGYFSCLQRMLAAANCGGNGIIDNKDGGFIYSPLGDKGGTYTSNSGGGLFALIESGVPPTDPRVNAGITWLDASMASNGGTNACQNNFHTGTSLASNWTADATLSHYALWANMKAHLLADVSNGGTVPNPTLALSNYYGNLASCIIGQQNANGSFGAAPRETDLLATEFSVLTLEKVVVTTGLNVTKRVEQVGNKLFFTVNYTNGSNTVYGAFIQDPLPSGTTFISSGCGPPCTPPSPAPIGGILTFGLGTLAPGATGAVYYSVSLNANLLNGNRICNCATAFWYNSQGGGIRIDKITWNAGKVHVTLSKHLDHSPPIGSSVTIKGVSPKAYNGTFVITGSSKSTVAYALEGVGAIGPGHGGVIVIPTGPVSSRGDCIDMIVDRKPTTDARYTGDTAIGTAGHAMLSAVLVDRVSATPISGETLHFDLTSPGTDQSCQAVADSSGVASCMINDVTAQPGTAFVHISFAGDKDHPGITETVPVAVYQSLDTLTYTGPTTFTNGSPGQLSAQLTQTNSGNIIANAHVKFTLNEDGVAAQSCSGNTNSSGIAACTINSVSQPDGNTTMDVNSAGNGFNYPANHVTVNVGVTGP